MEMIFDLQKYADRTALLDDAGGSLRYAELYCAAKLLKTYMRADRSLVFCLCTNTIGSVLGYVSFLNGGDVPVLLNANIESGLFRNLLNLYQPSYLWLPEKRSADFPEMKPLYRTEGYVLLDTGFENRAVLHEQLALLLTTSGSTGSPKFVRQSYENIRANTDSIIAYLELDASERPITTLPMNYTYGLSILNTHLTVGATILLTEKTLFQREFWQFFTEQEATSFGGVPYTYEMLEKLRFFRMDLPSLRTMTQAGGKLIPELHEKFARYAEETGRRFFVMYGQCEATARMGYLPAEKAVKKKGSMGIAIPGGTFRLIGTDGEEITAPYTTGELVYEGKNVTLGYAQCLADLAKGDERRGTLETGDMAQFDEDGYYYIVGRKKRFLKIYGNRVNLDETDRLIKGKFETEAACAGVDDHMYIFLTDESLREAVPAYVSEVTGLNQAAFHVVVLPEIPKNDAGKTQYTELERYYDDL